MFVDSGCSFRFLIEPQLKVPMETMIITATSAAMGICTSHWSRTSTMISRKTPAVSVDRRVRPPDFTLMMDWPIMAQPAMPPSKPAPILATPCPLHSRLRSLVVSVRSSTMVAVIMDSSRPTTARPSEYGRMIIKVSRFSGTFGHRKIGSVSGNSPMSPTVRISRPTAMATPVNTMMHTSGDGSTLPTTGT